MNNLVSQIMFSSGNAAVLDKGSRITSLAVGQIGIFNYKTGLSIDETSAVTDADEFFIAVGVDRDGDTVLDDVIHSAGEYIQMRSVTSITYRCYTPSQAQTVDITDFVANCNTEYTIKIRLQLEKAYVSYGFNLPGKTFAYVTDCCNDCGTGCPSGDCNELALGLETAINNDPDGLFIANFLDYTTTPGTPVVVADADYAAWVADVANAGKCLGIRITTIPAVLGAYVNGINLKYDYPRVPTVIVSLIEGFDCNGVVTVSQNPIHSEGDGYDLMEEESNDAGQNGNGKGPFRTSALIGVPFDNYQSTALSTGKYAQYIITGGNVSSNGGSVVTNLSATCNTIAIPCADTATRTDFVTIMDALTANKWSALIASNVACPACTVANEVTTQNDNTKIGDAR